MNQQTDRYSDDILRAIRRIIRKISDHSRYVSRHAGITVPQLLCLQAIAESRKGGEEVTLASISKMVQLAPPTVTGIVDRLERGGFVKRERNSGDRRKITVVLTLDGQKMLDTLPHRPLQEVFIRRLMNLDESERRKILSVLHQLVDLMEAQEIDASPILAHEDVRKTE